ncbi:MAG: hypothetical protein HFJ58_05240 [Clostridia bacterium]|nr:hypothetical protein [Clostridia bacterium]
MNYIEGLRREIKQYYKILSKEFPEFLYDYINTREMQRINGSSIVCGTDWTSLYNNKFYYTNLEHSIGVALIIWNFTKDKKQTLAGLFHDIATPAFKHCIDFMNGDYTNQESTEAKTEDIIKNSKEIMNLLEHDGIKLEEVVDYHIYPIADNDTPKLSADRLEYTFMNGIFFEEVWDLEIIKKIYDNIEVLTNEEGIHELGFKNIEIAEEFVKRASKIWPKWIDSKDKLTMQFIADTVRKMNEYSLLKIEDLYRYSEKEIIEKINNSGIKEIEIAFKKFQEATQMYEGNEYVQDKYCISIESKRRYIDPLVKCKNEVKRIKDISNQANQDIERYLKFKTEKYAYFDFNF